MDVKICRRARSALICKRRYLQRANDSALMGVWGGHQVKNLERRTEEGMPFGEVARYLVSALHHAGGRSDFGRSGSGNSHLGQRIGYDEADFVGADSRGTGELN